MGLSKMTFLQELQDGFALFSGAERAAAIHPTHFVWSGRYPAIAGQLWLRTELLCSALSKNAS